MTSPYDPDAEVPPVTHVRVFVADDHPVYREGLVEAIRQIPGIEIVGEAADGILALERVTTLAPDVALLDVELPGLKGPEVLQALMRAGVPTRVLFLSGYLDSAVIYEVLAAGASGYLSKDARGAEIGAAIFAVARGEVVMAPQLQAGLVDQIRIRESETQRRLTERETEILVLVADGYSAPEIGRRLFLSTSTIKTHMQHLYEKLGVSDRAAAVAEAMRRGLLT